MTDLTTLLETATEHIQSRGLAARALVEARRRRTRRRAMVATASGTLAVVAAVFAADVVSVNTQEVLTPQVTPSTPTSPTSPSPTRETTMPDLPAGVVEPVWDPRRVDELPAATGGSALPDVITPPASAPQLADSPMESAVLSVDRGSAIQLLGSDNSWRSVPVPDENAPAASLAPGGSRLSVPTPNGVEVWDLASGTHDSFGLPAGFKAWDNQTMRWIDDRTLLLDDFAGGWLLDTETGSTSKIPYPTEYPTYWALDPSGALVQAAEFGSPLVLTDWATGQPHKVPMTSTGRLYRLVISQGSVVGVSYADNPINKFAVIVADRADLTPRAILPIRDHDANYSNWALGPVIMRDDDTVLLWTAVPGTANIDGWRLVAWDPDSGDLSILARSDANPTWGVSFARDLLR